jgi:type IV pilus assembly protein PilE
MSMPSTTPLRTAAAGFTLIELMVTVAIVAILSAIAYPAYTEYILKSRRTDAKNALLDLAARQERFYSLNNQYSTVPSALGYSGAAFPVNVQTGNAAYYQMTVTAPAPAAGTLPTFTASAAPLGQQTKDKCGTYSLNHLGIQGNSTTATGCW